MGRLESRLAKVEARMQPPGEHAPVRTMTAGELATVHVYGCSCGQTDCRQQPTLTLILKQYSEHFCGADAVNGS